jgi:hypothetical protein
MRKQLLIGLSFVAVVFLILGSLSNVVGYQTVQTSNQKVIKDEVNQKELLFQTIADIANNKEIQQVLLKSQISREGFFSPGARFSVFTPRVLTKNQLKHMYVVGLMLSKIISKSKIHSIVQQFQMNNQEVPKEITAVIEKDAILKGEIKQLSNSKCDCENDNTTRFWNFPVICTLLIPFLAISFGMYLALGISMFFAILWAIGAVFNCAWHF